MAPERHRVTIQPLRVLTWDPELRCERLRGLGYRAVCTCGAKSRVVASHAAARALAGGLVHVGEDHGTSSEAR